MASNLYRFLRFLLLFELHPTQITLTHVSNNQKMPATGSGICPQDVGRERGDFCAERFRVDCVRLEAGRLMTDQGTLVGHLGDWMCCECILHGLVI